MVVVELCPCGILNEDGDALMVNPLAVSWMVRVKVAVLDIWPLVPVTVIWVV